MHKWQRAGWALPWMGAQSCPGASRLEEPSPLHTRLVNPSPMGAYCTPRLLHSPTRLLQHGDPGPEGHRSCPSAPIPLLENVRHHCPFCSSSAPFHSPRIKHKEALVRTGDWISKMLQRCYKVRVFLFFFSKVLICKFFQCPQKAVYELENLWETVLCFPDLLCPLAGENKLFIQCKGTCCLCC